MLQPDKAISSMPLVWLKLLEPGLQRRSQIFICVQLQNPVMRCLSIAVHPMPFSITAVRKDANFRIEFLTDAPCLVMRFAIQDNDNLIHNIPYAFEACPDDFFFRTYYQTS